MHAFIQRNRRVLASHRSSFADLFHSTERIKKNIEIRPTVVPQGDKKCIKLSVHRLSNSSKFPLPLSSSSSRLLQKQSHSSRHGIGPIPRWRLSTSSSLLPLRYSDRTTPFEGIFFSSESTNAYRSFHEIFDQPRARLPGEESIDPLARRPKEYLSGCWFAAIYEPCTSYLDVQSHQFVDPSRFRPSVHAVVHSTSVQHGLGRDRRLD